MTNIGFFRFYQNKDHFGTLSGDCPPAEIYSVSWCNQ